MRLKNVSLAIALLKICIVLGQNDPSKNIIIIDPGHGGIDTGAHGENGLLEKDVVLQIAKEMIVMNGSVLDNGLDIYLSRYTDTLVSLADRGQLARALKPDLFVSLHCNHATDQNAKGTEIYVHPSSSQFSKSAIGLGLSVMDESTKSLGFETRGLKFANFQVLRDTRELCPAILIELGFLSNPNEADYLIEPRNLRALALAILMGITDYIYGL